MPHSPLTWYFPIGNDQVYACDWDDDRQQYTKDCRIMPASAVPRSSPTTEPRFEVAAALSDKTQPLPPNWFFSTGDRDWLLSCERNPTTGRYDMNAYRVHLSSIGQSVMGVSSKAGSVAEILASATREIRRKQPFLADVLLVSGAVALLNVISNATLGATNRLRSR